ncbi:hypothetical protein [Flammeovirga kamogawensis]|uniref:Uncharacterized protein n=1 Tax=Flammeovirga kamogawensis TaxID=373891 RepID=A0ABX8GUU4_9BACT|nr:hypothetical protein [Flammeovirga kamogawensis]MBB6459880.1 hypothetical protein [Flammeovirga kamogawensis]QWG07067.1 hypothetical protein KM029_17460 [Flammeovirga kamogawensis]TRX68888.1 hypothetical protein EO216_12450 [Flammeovirga kamogawensis]
MTNKLKLVFLLLLSFCLGNQIIAADDIIIEKDAKVYIHKSGRGTTAYAFNPNGTMQYIVEYSDGSFYEFSGTYRLDNAVVMVHLEEGKGKNNSGIEMNNLKPKRADIEFLVKDDSIIESGASNIYQLLQDKKEE